MGVRPAGGKVSLFFATKTNTYTRCQSHFTVLRRTHQSPHITMMRKISSSPNRQHHDRSRGQGQEPGPGPSSSPSSSSSSSFNNKKGSISDGVVTSPYVEPRTTTISTTTSTSNWIVDERFTGIEVPQDHDHNHLSLGLGHLDHPYATAGIASKACWPYNYFASPIASKSSSDREDNNSTNNENRGSSNNSSRERVDSAHPYHHHRQSQLQAPLVLTSSNSQPVDLDDSYPSDEEDRSDCYNYDDTDPFDTIADDDDFYATEHRHQCQHQMMTIEVTEDQYCQTISRGDDGDDKNSPRRRRRRNNKNRTDNQKGNSNSVGMTRRIGKILSPIKKKIGHNLLSKDNDEGHNRDHETEKSLMPLLRSPERSTAPIPSSSPNFVTPNKRNTSNNETSDTNSSIVIPETSSVSDVISAFGQQSVANKTVNSFASTIKVSNRQDPGPMEQDQEEDSGNNMSSRSEFLGAARIKPTKAWKKFKSLVKVGGGGSNPTNDDSNNDNHDGQRDPTPKKMRSSSSLSSFPMRRRARSEDHMMRSINRDDTDQSSNSRNNAIGWGVKSISWETGIWRKQRYGAAASSAGEEDDFCRNSKHRGRKPQKYQQQQQKQMKEQRQIRSQQNLTDRAIRGRLDGVDIVSLGPACRSTLPDIVARSKKSPKQMSTSSPNWLRKESDHQNDSDAADNQKELSALELDPLTVLFTDIPSFVETPELVSDMISMSAGQEHTEIILEGFFPGGSDRWTVRLDDVSSCVSAGTHPTLKTASMTDDESTAVSSDCSTNIPSNRLWNHLWGPDASPPPTPYHMKSDHDILIVRSSTCSMSDEELQHKFAVSCNVPIDLDDDAFIVSTPEHLYAVHEVIMLPIQARRFDTAIGLFLKLLRGLEGAKDKPEIIQWMIGSTHHNIGMMHMCQAHFGDALQSFRNAVMARKQCLPAGHPDIAVSLARRGIAYFALNSFNEARQSFEAALDICQVEDATRAKILGSLAVVHYQLEDYGKAIKLFTSALEIQRQWLDGPVRREALVYDASVTLTNLGKCYQRKDDYDLAYFVYEEAWLLQTSHFRHDHDIVLTSQDNMARAQATNGSYAEALRIFSSLARSLEERFGSSNEFYIEIIGMKGLVHYRLLELEEAESCLARVSTWQSKHLWWSHPSIQNTKALLKQVKRCLKGDDPMWL